MDDAIAQSAETIAAYLENLASSDGLDAAVLREAARRIRRGDDMNRWQAAQFAATHETLAITLFRDLYSDPPAPKQWHLADDETKRLWRASAMELMIDAAMLIPEPDTDTSETRT